jgi:hypothetical protein
VGDEFFDLLGTERLAPFYQEPGKEVRIVRSFAEEGLSHAARQLTPRCRPSEKDFRKYTNYFLPVSMLFDETQRDSFFSDLVDVLFCMPDACCALCDWEH